MYPTLSPLLSKEEKGKCCSSDYSRHKSLEDFSTACTVQSNLEIFRVLINSKGFRVLMKRRVITG